MINADENFKYHPDLISLNWDNIIDEKKFYKNEVKTKELLIWKNEIHPNFKLSSIKSWKEIVNENNFNSDNFQEVKNLINIGFIPDDSYFLLHWFFDEKECCLTNQEFDHRNDFTSNDVIEWINAGLKKEDLWFLKEMN